MPLFLLPSYSLDRHTPPAALLSFAGSLWTASPGQLVWKHLKADTIGRMAVASNENFAKKFRRAMAGEYEPNYSRIINMLGACAVDCFLSRRFAHRFQARSIKMCGVSRTGPGRFDASRELTR